MRFSSTLCEIACNATRPTCRNDVPITGSNCPRRTAVATRSKNASTSSLLLNLTSGAPGWIARGLIRLLPFSDRHRVRFSSVTMLWAKQHWSGAPGNAGTRHG
jgi:hypothetical protein